MSQISRRMMMKLSALSVFAVTATPAALTQVADPLPSWNDTAPKAAIVAFVDKVTREGTPDFVAEPERVAVFDNDGTLWVEQPTVSYTHLTLPTNREV